MLLNFLRIKSTNFRQNYDCVISIMEPRKDNIIDEQRVEEVDGKQAIKVVDENTVRRDESCVKARIKRYRSMTSRGSSSTTLTSDSRTVIEYVSDKLKLRQKGCHEASFSDKMKKQAALIKQLLEQQKIQPIKPEQSNKEQIPSEMTSEKDDSDREELTENFDQSMQYIERKIREHRDQT